MWHSVNLLTVVFVLLLLWGVVAGFRRRFALETSVVLAQLVAIAAGLCALFAAWYGSARLSHVMQSGRVASWPQWEVQLARTWQQAPGVLHALAFIVVYLLVAAILRRLLMLSTSWLPGLVPGFIGKSRTLGAGLGLLVGAARMFLLGAVIFLALSYLSIPPLSRIADTSSVYKGLRSTAYTPWLKPLLDRELPVLETQALAPLSQNINLFVLPVGAGQERAVLIIPKQVAAKAQQITVGDTTPKSKAYALYDWEIHHVRYNWKKYDEYVYHHHWEQQSPLQTLETGEGVCADYALLYADLAHSVGLTVQIDEGIGGVPGNEGSHAWNKVWNPATSHWIPVDTTWGSQQDDWFDAPNFSQTHHQQTEILIQGAQA